MNKNNSRGLLQFCGIHPFVAVMAIAVDTMLFAETASTLGVGWLISIPVAMVLALVTTIIQKKSYGDGWLTAMAKGVGIGLLTAIPTPLPSTLTAGLGFLGLFNKNKIEDKSNKKDEEIEEVIIIEK